MRWYFYRRLTWGQAAWIFGSIGIICMAGAAYMTWRSVVQLRTWPRVEAHVDSAQIVPRSARQSNSNQKPTYAVRLWLTYTYDGRSYAPSADEMTEWSDYGFAVQAGNEAVHVGRVTAMLDPAEPRSAVLRQGSWLGPFALPLGLTFFGLLFLGIGVFARRAGSRLGMDAPSGERFAPAPRMAIAIFGITGALFVGGAVVAAIVGTQSESWTPVEAHVDSAGAVQVSQNMYSVRRWLTYTLNGTTYHAPITAGTSRNSFSAVSRSAAEAAHGGLALLVDPQNPYRVTTPGASRAAAIWLPLLFGFLGTVCLVVAVWIHRKGAAAFQGRASGPFPAGPGRPRFN